MAIDEVIEKLLLEQKRHIVEQVRILMGDIHAQTIEDIEDIVDWNVLKKYLK